MQPAAQLPWNPRVQPCPFGIKFATISTHGPKKGIDVDAWARSARKHGAMIVTASPFTLDGRSLPFMRLGFASLNPRELEEGVRRLAAAISGRS